MCCVGFHKLLHNFPRNLYNEWVLCTKKAEEAGDDAKKCYRKRHNALALCPDEWVSFFSILLLRPPGIFRKMWAFSDVFIAFTPTAAGRNIVSVKRGPRIPSSETGRTGRDVCGGAYSSCACLSG